MKPSTPEAFQLMMEGTKAFADIEENGMRIDVEYLDKMLEQTSIKIKEMERDLRNDEVYHIWRKVHGERSNLGSRRQLAQIIFAELGVECKHKTKRGRAKTDTASLEEIDFPFVRKWNNFEKLKRLRSTNLVGVKRETVNGFLRSFINLHLAITYRSSTSDVNFQAQPIRDPKQAKIIRRAFIPRDNHVLVESDYTAIEVRGAACYHKDPTMIQYIEDDYDLHSDMAAEIYLLDKDQVTKQIRYIGKNGFVFPSFYGDWYHSICQSLWKAVDTEKLTLKDGTSLRDHLTNKGITELGNLSPKDGTLKGSYEDHIKQVDDRFWNKRFPVYAKWKEDWWNEYLKQGCYMMKTGFVSKGVFRKNEVINGPIQGSSFHCLLWSVIELNKWLKKNKMKSMIVGQIHDSIVADVHKDELDDYLEVSNRIMSKDIRKAWDWIIVPLAVEAEKSETNWYEMEEVKV